MFYDLVNDSKKYIESNTSYHPTIGIILGSGLNSIVSSLQDIEIIEYKDIPNFPQSKVSGHDNKLILGKINNVEVICMSGRFHYYEGFSMKEVAYPIYVMSLLGVKELIITNACGGINPNYFPGDIMIIKDFINTVSDNPLRGENDERFGTRFPDMSEPYDLSLIKEIEDIASDLKIETQKGVYALFQGPYYESAAEIKMLSVCGADAVGMSSVPETIAAIYLGMKVIGLSIITNKATGLSDKKHDHNDVLKKAQESSNNLCKILTTYLSKK